MGKLSAIARPYLAAQMSDPAGPLRLFVGNVAYKTDGRGLGDALVKFGPIEEITIVSEVFRGVRRSRGFAFAQFKTQEGYNAVLRAGGPVVCDGRVLVFRPARPRGVRRRDTVFVRGIPAGTTQEDIIRAMEGFTVQSVRILREDSTTLTGFAFVKMGTEEEQARIVQRVGQIVLYGKVSRLFFARPPQRPNQRFPPGRAPPPRRVAPPQGLSSQPPPVVGGGAPASASGGPAPRRRIPRRVGPKGEE